MTNLEIHPLHCEFKIKSGVVQQNLRVKKIKNSVINSICKFFKWPKHGGVKKDMPFLFLEYNNTQTMYSYDLHACLQPFDNTFAINRRIIGNNFIPNAVLLTRHWRQVWWIKTLLFKYPHNQKSQALQARRPPTSPKSGVWVGILVHSIYLSRTSRTFP